MSAVDADKAARRRERERRRADRVADRFAQCGLSYYAQSPEQRRTGCFWATCNRCKRPLDYRDVLIARECKP